MSELPIHYHFVDKFQLEANDMNCFDDFSDTSCELFLKQPLISTREAGCEELQSVQMSQPIRNLKQLEGTNLFTGFVFPSLLEVHEERIMDQEFSTEYSDQHYQKQSRKNQKQYQLATRNVLPNFATNLISFIEFRIQKAILSNDLEKIEKFSDFKKWLIKQKPKMRKLQDWKILVHDLEFGSFFRKVIRSYFGKSFAESYILHSKITKSYKQNYYQSIHDLLREFKEKSE